MKKSIIAILLLTSVYSSAQIKEINPSEQAKQLNKVALMGVLAVKLSVYENEGNYFLTYIDNKYTYSKVYKTLNLGDKETVLEYKDLMLGLIETKTKTKTFELNDHIITFDLVSRNVKTYITNKAGVTSQIRWINKKQINKLFKLN